MELQLDTSLTEIYRLPEFEPKVSHVNDPSGAHIRIGWVRIIENLGVRSISAIRPKELVILAGIDLEQLPKWANEIQLSGAAAVGVVAEQPSPRPVDVFAQKVDLPLTVIRSPFEASQAAQTANLLILNHGVRAFKLRADIDNLFLDAVKVKMSVQELISEIARTLNKSVFLEGISHQLIAYHLKGGDTTETIDNWSEKSRKKVALPRTGGAGVKPQWLFAPVTVNEHDVGRLVIPEGERGTLLDEIVLDRGTSALSLLLVEPEMVVHPAASAEGNLIAQIVSGALADEAEARSLFSAMNLNFRLHGITPVIFGPKVSSGISFDTNTKKRALINSFRKFSESKGIPVIAGESISGHAGALIGAHHDASTIREHVEEFSKYQARRDPSPVVIALGRRANRFEDIPDGWTQTLGVLKVVSWCDCSRIVHTQDDVKLLDLLVSLRGDPRLDAFVYRTMGPILYVKPTESRRLLRTLQVYIESFGNKSQAANTLGIGRPTLYKRMRQLEEAFGGSLEDVNVVLEGFLALRALKVLEDVPGNDRAVIGNWRRGTYSGEH